MEDRRTEEPGGAEVAGGYRKLSTKTGGMENKISGRRNRIGGGFGRTQLPQGLRVSVTIWLAETRHGRQKTEVKDHF